MKAVISDVHGNLEALEAVFADIRAQGIGTVYCLGDIISDGPNPRECLDLVMGCQICLSGNHDRNVREVIGLSPSEAPNLADQRRLDFARHRPLTHREESFLFAHGSPRPPHNEYVFPEDVYDERKMRAIFGFIDRVCVQGHTHIPGVITEDFKFLSPGELNGEFTLDRRKALINVGSVGQPRDGDNRASYVILDSRQLDETGRTATVVIFRRVGYDFERTMDKLRKG